MFWNIQNSIKILLILFLAMLSKSHAEQDNYISKSLGTTRIKFERLKYTWTIENFNSYNFGNGVHLTLPPFSTDANHSCKYQLSVFPDGYNLKTNVSVFVLTSLNCPATVEYKFAILNTQFKEIHPYSATHQFKSRHPESIGLQFFDKEVLLNPKNGLLSNDKLTIIWELNVRLGVENTLKLFKQPQPQSSYIGKNFAYLFGNQNFTDVVISTGGKEFRGLKPILAARSEIFRSMFENDMQEAAITRIEISDLDPEVVEEMLRYIYTEQVSNLEYLAPALLVASEKYKIDGLKDLCVSSMVDSITIECAVEFYILSDTYSVDDLKIQVKNFIANQASSIPGFMSMMQTHRHLVEELFGTVGDLLSKPCSNIN